MHEGGYTQLTRRIATPAAMAWTEQTRSMFAGLVPRLRVGQAERPRLHASLVDHDPLRRGTAKCRGQRSKEGLCDRAADHDCSGGRAGLALAGCGSSSKSGSSDDRRRRAPKARPQVTITAHDFGYTMPAADPGGLRRRDARQPGQGRPPGRLREAGLDDVRAVQGRGDRRPTSRRSAGHACSSAVRTTPTPAQSTTATVKLDPGNVRRRVLHPGRTRRQAARRARA